MADFEDANSPTWHNMVDGHRNLRDAIDGTITYRDSDGKTLRARPRTRRRCWCARAAGTWSSATCWSSQSRCPARCSTSACTCSTAPGGCCETGPVRTSTCRRWNPTSRRGCGTTCSCFAQEALGMPRGTIKATVLIETLPAAFEMDEILYELREHSAGLNAGRWDYIFSSIKCFPDRREMVLPGPRRRDDDRAVHARLHRAAGRDLPQARRARDGRDVGADPEPQGRRGGQREGARRGPRGQGARGLAGLRRHLGRASGPRAGRARGVRAGPRTARPTSSSASATTST